MTMLPEPVCLSRDEARQLTDEVKHDAERLWRKLVELYDGHAHEALGYSSWGAYFATEFGQSQRHAYRLLNAGRALEIVASDQLVTGTPSEAQARELTPLLSEPTALREAWQEANDRSGGQPTAAVVREVVEERRPRLVIPIDEEALAQQQRETAISNLDRSLFALEMSEQHARAECRRIAAGGNVAPLTPERFDKAAAFALAFADELRKAVLDGQE